MKELELILLKQPELKSPIMVEGLPGVGNVGKLVADYLVDQLQPIKVAEIYSFHFPPQVLVQSDGLVRLLRNELYAYQGPPELLILVGDAQSVTNQGHYLLSQLYLDLGIRFGASKIYTLGGYGTGKPSQEIRIYGAANTSELISELSSYGVTILSEEPGGIVGASGLLLGLAGLKGIPAACLMGSTPGYFVDPRSAKVLLETLCRILRIQVSTKQLEQQAQQLERKLVEYRPGLEIPRLEYPGYIF